MISEELKAIVDKLNEQGKMNFFDATTEEKIMSFEKGNEITLPSKYKEWLMFSDGGELFLPAGVQLYGIEHTASMWATRSSWRAQRMTDIHITAARCRAEQRPTPTTRP